MWMGGAGPGASGGPAVAVGATVVVGGGEAAGEVQGGGEVVLAGGAAVRHVQAALGFGGGAAGPDKGLGLGLGVRGTSPGSQTPRDTEEGNPCNCSGREGGRSGQGRQ